ncbi:hypothetical protein [Mechercharimyces sp. CAU 1602]|uniref:hypothetical protein n=1 Tax=Mechercharimyces sp. CAU 1602 TaxID=2973933 RepID=UPI002163CDB9|nr:hypothetical protein [Mechercharimyces sp. CAU 1602]MCS1350354.1 hypothetical protein [Mechercharimyces sp. CAU 1602]
MFRVHTASHTMKVPRDGDMEKRAHDFFEKELPKMGFDDADQVASFVCHLREQADLLLEDIAIMVIQMEGEEEGE